MAERQAVRSRTVDFARRKRRQTAKRSKIIMSIQYKFIVIPIKSSEEAETEFNLFLRSHRVLTVHREFVQNCENSFWCMGIEYLTGEVHSAGEDTRNKKRIDYKESLSPDDFSLFVKLREWRKETAEREGVPVFTIFTNEQLAEIVRNKAANKTELMKIDGIGEGRVTKYSDGIIKVMGGIGGGNEKNGLSL